MSEPAECAVRPPPTRSHRNTGPRRAINRQSRLTQALDLQDRAYKAATNDETPIHVQAAFMRAWVDIQEIGMAIRGQGKPKPVEARNATRKVGRSSANPVASPIANGT